MSSNGAVAADKDDEVMEVSDEAVSNNRPNKRKRETEDDDVVIIE